MTLFPVSIRVGSPVATGLLLCLGAAPLLSACAPRSCANPYVLDFMNKADARASLSHVALLHDPVVTVPGSTPDTLSCSVWERVRVPGTARTVLQPQFFRLRQVGDGWEVDAPAAPGGGA